MTQKERVAYNESFFRDLNERKAEWLKRGLQAAGFRCEWWRMGCVRRGARGSCGRWRNPCGDVFTVSQITSNSARSRACSSGGSGALFSGVHQLAVRW